MSIDRFTEAYITCALWSSTDESDDSGGEPLDKNYDIGDLAPDCLARMVDDCRRFQAEHETLLDMAYATDGYDAESAGHDFWLTRNGHGAGFWDRDLGDIGDKLTKAAHAWGECNLYVSDGAIHRA